MDHRRTTNPRRAFALAAALLACLAAPAARAQDTVTGAFEGTVSHFSTRERVAGALVEITNQASGITIRRQADAQGRFYQGLLPPGVYTIRVSAPGFEPKEKEQLLFTTGPNQVVPIPVLLEPEAAAPARPPAQPQPPAQTAAAPAPAAGARDVVAEVNTSNARHGGAFTADEISTLPLGETTIVRTFDELALLLPGVAPPPQTLGSVAGPGVGPGVGSAGQFAVNGLRSRANNFTVDGSDNNDEDIGVRRQGFVALIPQPVESIREYQVITLLAPAQFGRNIGAQVNAVTRSGGQQTHGTLYATVNTSRLNARNPFDTDAGTAATQLIPGGRPALLNGRPLTVVNRSGGEDSFTFAQGGLVLGGPLVPNAGGGRRSLFYFFAAEGQLVNATQEASFAVPTVEERGLFGSGATGLARDPLGGANVVSFPSTVTGDAIFSLFPFPNSPAGIYGPNTFTQSLPAGGQGKVLSGKLDANFFLRARPQSFTARYNFSDDWRDIPATGGALFSTLRPRVRAQNLSTYLNSELSAPGAATPVFNQVRASYGRTRLVFHETRDTEFLVPSELADRLSEDEARFLLNAPARVNDTLPALANVSYHDFFNNFTVEDIIGPVGQVAIAGFSPAGVDVFNFPQRRVNNTYQLADILTARRDAHDWAFGADVRRTELNSDLPRNARPLITFGGAPRLERGAGGAVGLAGFFQPTDLVAASAPTGVYQALTTTDNSAVGLRYYQLNFFGQDEWRVRRNLSLSLGLRYEYNTPPREVNRLIEETFDSPALALVPGLSRFIDGRTRIFDPDRDNFAPRLGVAYSPAWFGAARASVMRAGVGVFHDQAIGAVVSQSRNVFPTSLTLNLAGGLPRAGGLGFNLVDPRLPFFPCRGGGPVSLTQPGTLNRLNPAAPLSCLVEINSSFPGGFGFTLPERRLNTPEAYHFTASFEQQLGPAATLSAAYVGTRGRHLLRLTTPNLGPGALLVPTRVDVVAFQPNITGLAIGPGQRVGSSGALTGGRPVAGAGAVYIYEGSASSDYDSLQLQLRGRLRRALQYQLAYTFSRAEDDVSDVFDLAGAPALPQNSLTFEGERGPANFDVRHRLAYSFIYDLPSFETRARAFRVLLGGLQVAGTGRLRTGQPFTVNSLYDVNLDGNLTDRPDTTDGLVRTGDRRRPLVLAADPLSLLAPVGQDGSVGRNNFRAGGVVELDLSLVKHFDFTRGRRVVLRADAFNFINRANYGIPVRFLGAPAFGEATSTITPSRRVQLALKFSF